MGRKIIIPESAMRNVVKSIIKEYYDEEESMPQYPVDDIDFEIDESDLIEIYGYKGPQRRFRGSIYYDGSVPETDDVEYDRKLAQKILDYERKRLDNMETYVGGVGFKTGSLIEPYDNMEF
tara:strand:- start:104068 stop:104430 length:363 start_codon:yes stop_codon:yes gene_type:complete